MDSLQQWKAARQACRTNLYYLCQVLGYKDVNPKVHGRLIKNLQQFKGGVDEVEVKSIPNLKEGQVALPNVKAIRDGYKPYVPNMWDMEGPRQRLNMIPRGHLKTTVATCAHSIQWIINYPNVRILIFSHSDGKAKDFLGMIRNHFIQNETFRYLFPEHVPWGKKANDFGNQELFDTCARSVWIEKEHTGQILTIDSAKSGGHFEVVKCDDVVDDTNVITADRIAQVKKSFGALEPLVDKRESADGGQRGWWDLTGTFYDFNDLNFATWESEKPKLSWDEWRELQAISDPEKKRKRIEELGKQDRKIELRTWECNVESAAPDWPDPNGKSLWPERFGYKVLKGIEDDPAAGPSVLASQYLMNPVPSGTGLIDSEDEIVWTPRKVLNELYARLSLYVAVDLAGMDETAKNFNKNDYTAITVGGFGTDGHLYILECVHGRPTVHQVIEHLFALYKRHPRITQIKIEKEAHARVLMPFLMAEYPKRGWLPVVAVPRDNQTSKTQKLKGLQPWFKQGRIHLADDLPCKFHLKNEIMRFPKFKDDILDTIHDLMEKADGGIQHEVMGDGTKDYSRDSNELDYEAAIYGEEQEQYTQDAITGYL